MNRRSFAAEQYLPHPFHPLLTSVYKHVEERRRDEHDGNVRLLDRLLQLVDIQNRFARGDDQACAVNQRSEQIECKPVERVTGQG
ncbi:hypothetical protein D3C84_948330 [compost metagenome]